MSAPKKRIKMSIDFLPTVEQTGFAIGFCLNQMPLLHPSKAQQIELLAEAEITETQLLSERFLLSFCAASYAIDQALGNTSNAKAVHDGLRRYLSDHRQNPCVAYALAELESGVSYYTEAALEDLQVGAPVDGNLSDIEMAFGDRLLDLGDDNKKRAIACIHLSMDVPSALWNAHTNSALQMMGDAKLLRMTS